MHRSLGVHISFVRSTQLDTTWTWEQLRAMQVGGNENAREFFSSHGCATNDAQQKYHSRAAKLYKDKLLQQAKQAMRTYGSKLYIGDSENRKPSVGDSTDDFFEKHSKPIPDSCWLDAGDDDLNEEGDKKRFDDDSRPGPKVENLSENVIESGMQVGKHIGVAPNLLKKTGRKSKFGGQKVKTDFSKLEQEAAENEKKRLESLKYAEETSKSKVAVEISDEDKAKQLANMKLAYKNLDNERKKVEAKIKHSAPEKAEQVERLGMGVGGRRGISHSIASEMKVITQDNCAIRGSERNVVSDDFDDDETFFDAPTSFSKMTLHEEEDKWNFVDRPSRSGLMKDDFNGMSRNKAFIDEVKSSPSSRSQRAGRNFVESSASGEAQKKFGNAKAISSQQYFGEYEQMDYETKSNLARFEGKSGISSADLFGDKTNDSSGGAGTRMATNIQYTGPDMQDIREGVKDGVTKVAGRLSGMARGMTSYIQDRYG